MDIANPPTLLFSIEYLYDYIQHQRAMEQQMSEESIDIQYGICCLMILFIEHTLNPSTLQGRLSALLPSVYKWYHWFNTTQNIHYESTFSSNPQPLLRYRWKSRTETHCLSSGISLCVLTIN